MREIIPNLLWIGHAQDARDVRRVMEVGIKSVIDLAGNEAPVPFPREVTYCRFPLHDGAGNPEAVLRAAVLTTSVLVEAESPTLVFCGAGMSRSPAIVAAALAVAEKGDFDAALLRVAEIGPHDVSPGLWSDIRRIFGGR